jgi:hypothetical protein
MIFPLLVNLSKPRHGRPLAAQAALRRVEDMHKANLLSLMTWQQLEPALTKQVEEAKKAQTSLLKEHPELQFEEQLDAEREGLNSQRTALDAQRRADFRCSF